MLVISERDGRREERGRAGQGRLGTLATHLSPRHDNATLLPGATNMWHGPFADQHTVAPCQRQATLQRQVLMPLCYGYMLELSFMLLDATFLFRGVALPYM